jgi:hypothetical protein
MTSTFHHDVATPSAGQEPAFTWAAVCNGPVNASYRRAGRGSTVVALTAANWRGGPAVFAALARDFRLIVPELAVPSAASTDHPAFAGWLTSFLDGLGLDAVSLVADERFGAVALGSALLDPDRIDGVAIVLDGTLPAAPDEGLAETLYCTRTKILVRWLGTDHDAAALDVARSLTVRRAAD